MSEALATVPASTGLSIFDSGTFEQMVLIASKLADSPILPETLRGTGKGQNFKSFEPAQIASNCFRVVEQASRWQTSPFAIMDCASVIHGKLMWEGKAIAAAISTLAGVRLNYSYSGEGVNRKVTVSGTFSNEREPRTIEGTVKDWKTDQWKASDHDQRLAYRGAREWARRHSPEVIFGVYSPDELDEGELRDANPRKGALEVRDDYKEPEKKEQPKPRPSVKEEPKGKQKKARYKTDCYVVGWQEMPREEKSPYFLFELKNKEEKMVKMSVFSSTIAAELKGVPTEEMIEVTYTKNEAGLSIESWQTIDPLDSEVEEDVA